MHEEARQLITAPPKTKSLVPPAGRSTLLRVIMLQSEEGWGGSPALWGCVVATIGPPVGGGVGHYNRSCKNLGRRFGASRSRVCVGGGGGPRGVPKVGGPARNRLLPHTYLQRGCVLRGVEVGGMYVIIVLCRLCREENP